jgi:hypothetical protein
MVNSDEAAGYHSRYGVRRSTVSETDETRLQIIKEILTAFPALREKVLQWLQETEPSENP